MADEWDDFDREQEAWNARIEEFRRRIVAQADAQGAAGWMEIDVPIDVSETGKLRVPRGAFEMWAVARSAGGHLVTPWEPVCPTGLKQQMDDRFHSDWLLGAGLALDAMRRSDALQDAANEASWRIQDEVLGFKCDVLMQGEYKDCIVVVPAKPTDIPDARDFGDQKPVAILPDAGPDWLAVAHATLKMGGAVIVERGGSMAHLVTALRDDVDGPIIRIPDARKKFAPGAGLHVSAASGEVTLHDMAFSQFANRPDPFRM